ncbi:MAG: tRNA (adenosine(37)-N6)-threonylcarbamoyltransferase complex dimerization subunit type 1 TsaB [Bacteroidetes bacterium]|nr:MAG: tRNA (adenosine(37)-N6)-threonylcarbamoyltransferase complex dimerization subunit type 1 TsaB [Bacteroidota bacterium]
MAKLLAIESTGSVCGVCLTNDDTIISEYSLDGTNVHDQKLADSIRKILSESGISNLKSLDAVAVSAGPGSFTGIRIGSSIAKALCFGDEPKFIAVPTLKAIAMSCLKIIIDKNYINIVPVIASVNNNCFYAKYDKHLQEQSVPELINLHELQSKLSDTDILCGNTGVFNEQEKSEDNRSQLPIGNEFYNIDLSAIQIAKLGLEMFKQGLFTNPEEFKPIYAQEFVPKFKLKTHKNLF